MPPSTALHSTPPTLLYLYTPSPYQRALFPPFFFFNDTATTEIYPLSLHDALPISVVARRATAGPGQGDLAPGPREGMSHTRYEPATPRLQRSELAVPGSQPALFKKALESEAD